MPDQSFVEFVIDQLHGMGDVSYRRMFGGYGLYCDSVFFAIIFKGRLYFKTDNRTRGAYLEQGMGPFRPSPKQTLKNYYEVPVDVLEDDRALMEWAIRAVRCQE